jgi:hypothetical protein
VHGMLFFVAAMLVFLLGKKLTEKATLQVFFSI